MEQKAKEAASHAAIPVSISAMLVTLGVVYGDIGTSPMYVTKALVAGNGGIGSVTEEFVLGALSSGMLLYGASLVYGFTGTVNYAGIAAHVQGGHAGLGLIFGIVFVAAGIAFDDLRTAQSSLEDIFVSLVRQQP